MKLNVRQKAFCEYYVASGNATESAIKAGYSKKNARQVGSENLTKPNIQEYIKQLSEKEEDKRIANMKEVKEFWTNILRDEEIKMSDRLKASEYIAKTNGAFLDKVEINGEMKVKNPFEGLTTEELKELIKNGK